MSEAMRLPRTLTLLLILAGCFGGPPPVGPPVAQTKAGFPPGGIADAIRIDATDRLPLRSAELVAPDGTATPAASVETTDSPRFATGQSTANDPWKTGFSGTIGPGTPALGSGLPTGSLRSQVQILTIVSTASIPLPDPAAYRRDWQHYRIRLGFGPPDAVETRESAAPEPPASAPAP